MPGIKAIIDAVSTDLNSVLVANGMPPLGDGRIMFGQAHVESNVAPPRVIFVPRGSKFGAKCTPYRSNVGTGTGKGNVGLTGAGVRQVYMDQYGFGYSSAPTITFSGGGGSGAAAVAVLNPLGNAIQGIALTASGSGYTTAPTVTITDSSGSQAFAHCTLQDPPEKLLQINARSIYTDTLVFDVHCWGVTGSAAATAPDPDRDFDATQVLYQQVLASLYTMASGMINPVRGVWTDSLPSKPQRLGLSHYYVFTVEVDTPIPDAPYAVALGSAPLQQAPVGVQANATLTLAPANGGTPGTPTTG